MLTAGPTALLVGSVGISNPSVAGSSPAGRGQGGSVRRGRGSILRVLSAGLLVCAGAAREGLALDKGHQILVNRGIQLQGLVITYDLFNLSTFRSGNFTTLHWN